MIWKKLYLLLFLLAGVFLSCVAAVYSVSGLVSIFRGATFAVMLMGITLEGIKVLISIYIHLYYKTVNKFLLSYLSIALIILMFITSLGIYGYLSKAFASSTDISGTNVKIISLQTSIDIEQNKIKTTMDQISSINAIPREEKQSWHFYRIKSLSGEIEKHSEKIDKLNTELGVEKQKIGVIESEVGPLKYLSRIIYGKEDKDSISSSVQLFIMIIVVVFDPLAVLSIISALYGFEQLKEKKEILENVSPIKVRRIKQEKTKKENPIKKETVKVVEEVIQKNEEPIVNIIKEQPVIPEIKNSNIDIGGVMVASYEPKDSIDEMYQGTPRDDKGFIK